MSNILYISRWFPYPATNGSKLRVFNLLRGLSQAHSVSLLSFADEPSADADAPILRSLCTLVETVPWRSYTPDSQRARVGFFSTTPRAYVDTYSREMEQAIKRTLAAGAFDLVIASQIDTAGYVGCWDGIPAIFEEVELAFLYEQATAATSAWQRLRFGLTWAKHKRYLERILRGFQACTVASEQEKYLLAKAVPGFPAVDIVPNCIDLGGYDVVAKTPNPNTVIFTGSFTYRVNYNAVVWFLREVYPRVQAQVPEVSLTITGNHANLPLPTTANVHLTGFVADIRPLLANSWVGIVPIWQGGGTRLKLLEAMALGTAVVSTTKGAEGLDVTHGEHLLVADTPEDFADAVISLLQDANLRNQLATNAYQQVAKHYDWTVVMPRFLRLVERTINGQGPGNRQSEPRHHVT